MAQYNHDLLAPYILLHISTFPTALNYILALSQPMEHTTTTTTTNTATTTTTSSTANQHFSPPLINNTTTTFLWEILQKSDLIPRYISDYTPSIPLEIAENDQQQQQQLTIATNIQEMNRKKYDFTAVAKTLRRKEKEAGYLYGGLSNNSQNFTQSNNNNNNNNCSSNNNHNSHNSNNDKGSNNSNAISPASGVLAFLHRLITQHQQFLIQSAAEKFQATVVQPRKFTRNIEEWEGYQEVTSDEWAEQGYMRQDFINAMHENTEQPGFAITKQWREWEYIPTAVAIDSWCYTINQMIRLIESKNITPMTDKVSRRLQLQEELARSGLKLRSDSSICNAYIERGIGELERIVHVTQVSQWLHSQTPYAVIKRRLRDAMVEPHRAKQAAIDEIVLTYAVPDRLPVYLQNRWRELQMRNPPMWHATLTSFKNDTNANELLLPADLSSSERGALHVLAESFELQHASITPRKNKEKQLLIWKAETTYSTETRRKSSSLPTPTARTTQKVPSSSIKEEGDLDDIMERFHHDDGLVDLVLPAKSLVFRSLEEFQRDKRVIVTTQPVPGSRKFTVNIQKNNEQESYGLAEDVEGDRRRSEDEQGDGGNTSGSSADYKPRSPEAVVARFLENGSDSSRDIRLMSRKDKRRMRDLVRRSDGNVRLEKNSQGGVTLVRDEISIVVTEISSDVIL